MRYLHDVNVRFCGLVIVEALGSECMRGGQERGETTEPLQSSHDLAMVGSNWRAIHDQKSGSQEIERNGKTGNAVGEASKVG